ncbi:hypothetical protein [Jeotgalibacillus soli]|uniref:D-isomer specific 2-hydroxyacid dehydrogenase catalytic domain-containing protein n=1 Tax=Jeotgalibacillus soli TaxID=889306 RepID=A0A0C2VT73_9BACL|nr:hypothetical protein [Jeotgalibacillus soli]KIL52127.1 hypothetical protein KP78_04970 [Jeotgalibacillus soli]
MIARHGIGLENVDVKAATEKGVFVCSAKRENIGVNRTWEYRAARSREMLERFWDERDCL